MSSRLVLALAGGLLFAACDSLPGKPTEADRPLNPDQVTDFAALYGSNCAGCHGADGVLGAGTPLGSPVYLALADDAALRAAIAEGVPGTAMPAFAASQGGTLTDRQIDLLIAGLRKRFADPEKTAGASLPPYSATAAKAAGIAPGDAGRGAAAYARACASCHGADGSGGPHGGSIVDPSYLALVSDQALRTAVIVGRADLGMPDWRGGAGGQALSAQEISDLVAWLSAQRKPYPGVASPPSRGG